MGFNKYNRLTVISTFMSGGRKYCDCVCECGGKKRTLFYSVKAGRTKSCGCYWYDLFSDKREKYLKQNPYRKEIYIVHRGMMFRCSDPSSPTYKSYGARGIEICPEWFDFESFYRWALSSGYSPGLEINRINNDKGYYPDNCNFVTRLENARNKRNTVKVELCGSWWTMGGLADRLGIKYNAVRSRLRSDQGKKRLEKMLIEKGISCPPVPVTAYSVSTRRV